MDREDLSLRRNLIAAGGTAIFVGALAFAHYALPSAPKNAEVVLRQRQAEACTTVQKAKAELVAKGLTSQAATLNVEDICNPGSTASFAGKLVLAVGAAFLAIVGFFALAFNNICNPTKKKVAP